MSERRSSLRATVPGFPDGHFYSPVVNVDEVDDRRHLIWSADPDLIGIDFRNDVQCRFLQDELARLVGDFDYPTEQGREHEYSFFEPNDYFMGLDSRALFVMLRARVPKTVVEVGSGFSSLLMADVNRRFLGSSMSITCIDPFPSEVLRNGVPGIERIVTKPVQVLPIDEFTRLEPGDVLFVDSSHVVKTGSDVPTLLLEIMPRLAAGVLVHFHDIFLPYEYPHRWVVEEGRSWNEQYMLRALLFGSSRFKILFGSQYATSVLRDLAVEAMDGQFWQGSSLWLEVVDDDPTPPSVAMPGFGGRLAYDPDLVPPISLMRNEGIEVLEEWFRWAEEWSLLLRVYGGLTEDSEVLEIGCGLGRTAFPLRHILTNGSYEGFDVGREKIDFLAAFERKFPHFRFTWVDVQNSCYYPQGRIPAAEFTFPYQDDSFDLVFAASVFTHMLPENVGRYLEESARTMKAGGIGVFSFFVLDNYVHGRPRPSGFGSSAFDFDHSHGPYGGDFAIVDPSNPERMTAFRLGLIEQLAERAGLVLIHPLVPGYWSGAKRWVGAQDLVVLGKLSGTRP